MCFSSQAPVVGSRLGLGEDEELDGRAQVFVSFFFVLFFFFQHLDAQYRMGPCHFASFQVATGAVVPLMKDHERGVWVGEGFGGGWTHGWWS